MSQLIVRLNDNFSGSRIDNIANRERAFEVFRVYFESLDLRQSVRSAIAFFSQEAQQRKVTLRADLPLRLPKVQADSERVQQVLVNLIGNALKFTPAGGKITVTVRSAGAGRAELEVADTGLGIALEDQSLLFQE